MIRKWVSTILFIIVCYILQTTLFQNLQLANVVPNLLVITTTSAAYLRGQRDGLFTGLLCGLLSDMIFGSVLGLHALIYMFIGFVFGYTNNIYWGNHFSIPLILIGLSDLAYGFLYYIFEFLLRGRLHLLYYFKNIILPEAAYTVLVAVVFYQLFYTLNRFTVKSYSKEEL